MRNSLGYSPSIHPRCPSTTHDPSHGLIRCSLESGHSGEHLGKGVKWTLPTLGEAMKSSTALVGWRAWNLDWCEVEGSYLRSLSADVSWKTPRMTTREGDRVRTSKAGLLIGSGDYGIYSYKTSMLMFGGLALDALDYPVVGKIDNLGHVVEHELGWRSQIAVVRELWVIKERVVERSVILSYLCRGIDTKPLQIVADLESRYKCQVNLMNDKQLFAWARWFTEDTHPNVRDRHEHR